jgi:hypothetical protein
MKLEIKALEIQISSLEDEKTETEKLIHIFELQYNLELGDLVIKLLKLRKERLKAEAQRDNAKKVEYEEAEKDYEEFQQNYEMTRHEEKFELTAEQLHELKTTYRKASRLCHPDVVAKEQKKEAEEIFKELNNAYAKNDLQKIKELFSHLGKGIFASTAEKVNEKDKLRVIIKRLRTKVRNLEELMSDLKQSETYKTVTTISDLKIYFQQTRELLQSEIEQLGTNG